MVPPRRFLVLDTESSICQETNRRVLISLAYQVVDVHLGTLTEDTQELHYDIVQQPSGIHLDNASEQIHGITLDRTQREGIPLCDALNRLLQVVKDSAPHAVVGHDIVGDIKLIVCEAIRAGMVPAQLSPLRNVLCTRQLSLGKCRLPLPHHLKYDYPCDMLLQKMNGIMPCNGINGYKWPSLEESYKLLASHSANLTPCYGTHDAREPGTFFVRNGA
jgi:hypothetical protein